MEERILKRAGRILCCLALVAVITYVCFALLHVRLLTAAFAYLPAILVIAARWGLLESLVTSLASMVCLNYFFLPPLLSFTFWEVENWVALVVFSASAITASQLSARARQRAREAWERQAEMEKLYRLSRSLMMIDVGDEAAPQIAARVKDVFGFSAVAFYSALDGLTHFAGPAELCPEPQVLREVASRQPGWPVWRGNSVSPNCQSVAVPVSFGGRAVASLGAAGSVPSEQALQAIANLAGLTVEHAQTRAEASRVEAARQSEQLRAALLDALAHDFVTPLTSIKGAITTVRSQFHHEPDEEDLLAVVEEESDRLNGMVSEAVEIARIEAGRVSVRRRLLPVADWIQASVSRMAGLRNGRRVEIQVPAPIAPLSADPDLAGVVLRLLLDNALKYAPPASPISISAREADGSVTLTVSDRGPGIPPEELELVFERYHRGSKVDQLTPGTGRGLSIAREIIQAHGGRIWAANRSGGGAEFSFTLPVAKLEVDS